MVETGRKAHKGAMRSVMRDCDGRNELRCCNPQTSDFRLERHYLINVQKILQINWSLITTSIGPRDISFARKAR